MYLPASECVIGAMAKVLPFLFTVTVVFLTKSTLTMLSPNMKKYLALQTSVSISVVLKFYFTLLLKVYLLLLNCFYDLTSSKQYAAENLLKRKHHNTGLWKSAWPVKSWKRHFITKVSPGSDKAGQELRIIKVKESVFFSFPAENKVRQAKPIIRIQHRWKLFLTIKLIFQSSVQFLV